jgi:hypothetical protein
LPLRSVRCLLLTCSLSAAAAAAAADAPTGPVEPYESSVAFRPANQIDRLVLAAFKARRVTPAARCSDAVFIRRVYLDVIGALPEPAAVTRFLNSRQPNKRAQLIEALLKHDQFNDYQAMKWCDLLRVKSEHPINLWPNGVQAYHRWIRQSVATDKPYDQFARELLTSSGSNFRVPPVNFYRAIQGNDASTIAAAVGLTFMGVRTDKWPDYQQAQMARFFSHVAYKGTAEWKEQIVYHNPAPRDAFDAIFPDGKTIRIKPDTDPRKVFADWLITKDNPYFTRNIANRVWAWLMGRGIIDPVDDLREGQSPVHAELLAYLERELIKADYDIKHLYRLILNSRTYQQSSISRAGPLERTDSFATYPVRRLEAEVLIDALVQLFGSPQQYSSAIPEPFTFVPKYQPTVGLADGSITSPFLELFGRPPRDTGLASERDLGMSESQRLYLINSSQLQRRIERSKKLSSLIRGARRDRQGVIDQLYLAILSRKPTTDESQAAAKYIVGKGKSMRDGVIDLTWALINSKEFLYRH